MLSGVVIAFVFTACDKTIPEGITDPSTLAGLKPSVAFSQSADSIAIGESVTFLSTSSRQPNKLFWEFSGGAPTTSYDRSPVVTYNRVGFFDVSLKATNNFGTDSILKKRLIRTHFKSNFSKDLSQWEIVRNWSYSSSANIPGKSGLLAYSTLLNASSMTIDYATVKRNFTNLPEDVQLRFWYYVYSPGGILNVKANGILLGSISGFGNGYASYNLKGGSNVEILFEAVLRQTQSIYISQITIHPL